MPHVHFPQHLMNDHEVNGRQCNKFTTWKVDVEMKAAFMNAVLESKPEFSRQFQEKHIRMLYDKEV